MFVHGHHAFALHFPVPVLQPKLLADPGRGSSLVLRLQPKQGIGHCGYVPTLQKTCLLKSSYKYNQQDNNYYT